MSYMIWNSANVGLNTISITCRGERKTKNIILFYWQCKWNIRSLFEEKCWRPSQYTGSRKQFFRSHFALYAIVETVHSGIGSVPEVLRPRECQKKNYCQIQAIWQRPSGTLPHFCVPRLSFETEDMTTAKPKWAGKRSEPEGLKPEGTANAPNCR